MRSACLRLARVKHRAKLRKPTYTYLSGHQVSLEYGAGVMLPGANVTAVRINHCAQPDQVECSGAT